MTTEAPKSKEPVKVSAGEDEVGYFLREIHQYPLLTAEQERELARRCAAGDEDAVRLMVNSNLRLVVSVAREYAGRGVPMLDLIQEGSIGLLAAARKFDYTLDFRFSTYATKWIRQGITRCLAKQQLIRVPDYTAERIRWVEQRRRELLQKTGQEPTLEQLAEKCDMSPQKIKQLISLAPQTCSLDAPAGDEDGGNLGHLLEDVRAPQPQEALVRQELERILNELLESLPERQRLVLRLHFGLADGTAHSLDEIGKILGISKERARQIEKQAMEKLQKMGENLGLEDFLIE